MKRRRYSARVQDKTGQMHDGDWFIVKTRTQPDGLFNTRKKAEAALASARKNNKNLIGHVTSKMVDIKAVKPRWQDRLSGKVVDPARVPEPRRANYERMLDAAAAAAAAAKQVMPITSSFRTDAEQKRLHDLWLAGKGPLAAAPGRSAHNLADALDSPNVRYNKKLLKELRKRGFRDNVTSEPWHLEFFG